MKKTFLVCILDVMILGLRLEAKEWTLQEVIQEAIKASHETRLIDLDIEKAEAMKMSALGQMGPKLGVSGKIIRWDQATEVKLGFEIPKELTETLGINIPSGMQVMKQTTSELSFSVVQPITPLVSLYSLYQIQRKNKEAFQVQRRAKIESTVFQATEAFYNILKLYKVRETALATKELVSGHLKTAKAFYEQGYVQKDDVLRAETALAKTEEGIHQIETAIDIAKSVINIMMGRQMKEPFEPIDTCSEPPMDIQITLEEALERAYNQRPEILEMAVRLQMAKAGRIAAIGAMLPTVAGIFNWTRQWGNKFQRDTSYFFGGTLQWNFWEWGSQYHQVKSAEYDIAKAKQGLSAIKDMVSIDVKSAYMKAILARKTLETSKLAVTQCEESLRIINKKYEQRTATSLEVINAESALTSAKNAYHDALYSCCISIANLKRAMGEMEVTR